MLTCVHLFANYNAVRSLRFSTLNQQRILHILSEYFRRGQVLTVDEANARESVILGEKRSPYC